MKSSRLHNTLQMETNQGMSSIRTRFAGREKSAKQKAPESTRTRLVPYQVKGIKILFTNADVDRPSKKAKLSSYINSEKTTYYCRK